MADAPNKPAVDYEALIKRLERGAQFHESDGDIGLPVFFRQAATAIRDLLAEREEMREALGKADGIASGPNGDGSMKITIVGFKPGEEAKPFGLLSDLIDAGRLS